MISNNNLNNALSKLFERLLYQNVMRDKIFQFDSNINFIVSVEQLFESYNRSPDFIIKIKRRKYSLIAYSVSVGFSVL